ncbi:hypothetical protein KIW84_056991 [Lathyrus oleraceus]|uniref:Helitron helicase-like domain-containing protein n=1 Tax=Pisum sativum TaxID=3888 RepID=A0A9D4X2E9_PEA|nr:hypothetical protein KIW84_056991 [Pisum sativum]
MSVEQRQEELARRRSNYRQNKDKGKQVQTCDLSDMRTMTPFQDLANANFTSQFYQRAHDNEAGPSTTYVSRVPSTDQNFTYPIFQQNDNHEARPFIRNIDDNDYGVHVDESLVATGRGIYTFRAQGAVYHKIGGFHPNQGSRPRYLHLYIYDTDNELQNRMGETQYLTKSLLIKERSSNQPHYSLPSTSQFTAIVIGDGDEDTIERGRDINVINYDGNLTKVQEKTMGYYDPLQYPILLPFGTYGWDIETKTNVGKNVTCREYYSYVLQIHRNDQSVLLKSGRLLQQYVVNNYVKIEIGRLRWIRRNQNNIRSEVYQGLQDALHDGENNADNVGQRTILPSSFIGSNRDMTQRYQDGMAIILNNGKPDIFLTMTCNPSWIEITSKLGLHQTLQDRPDLLTRIFRSKFEQLKDDVINKGVLGRVKSYMYVTEFHKRGLPHVHMLLILDTDDKLREPEEYDSVVKAEIPRHESEPELYEAVLKHMIHGPCGVLNQSSPCIKNGHCKKRYPKDFCEETRQGNDSYLEYMRRFSDPIFLNINKSVDNRWVVPYNPWLLLKYDCHINVEICSSIKSIKYLYKYVYKGPDRVAMKVHRGTGMDMIQQYVDARWIFSPEALWKIFKFTLYKLYPSVERLQIHLPNHHQVRFYKHQRITDVLNDNQNAVTMLTEFFALNQMDPHARNYLYREIPEHYSWLKGVKKWQRR